VHPTLDHHTDGDKTTCWHLLSRVQGFNCSIAPNDGVETPSFIGTSSFAEFTVRQYHVHRASLLDWRGFG